MSHFQSTGHSITYANQLAYMLFHARPRSAQIAAAGRTVRGPIAGVIVEHNLDLVLALADRVRVPGKRPDRHRTMPRDCRRRLEERDDRQSLHYSRRINGTKRQIGNRDITALHAFNGSLRHARDRWVPRNECNPDKLFAALADIVCCYMQSHGVAIR